MEFDKQSVISDFDIKDNNLPTLVSRFYNGTKNFTGLLII